MDKNQIIPYVTSIRPNIGVEIQHAWNMEIMSEKIRKCSTSHHPLQSRIYKRLTRTGTSLLHHRPCCCRAYWILPVSLLSCAAPRQSLVIWIANNKKLGLYFQYLHGGKWLYDVITLRFIYFDTRTQGALLDPPTIDFMACKNGIFLQFKLFSRHHFPLQSNFWQHGSVILLNYHKVQPPLCCSE